MKATKIVVSVLLLAGLTFAQGLATGWSQRADSGAGADNKLAAEGAAIHITTGGPPTNNASDDRRFEPR